LLGLITNFNFENLTFFLNDFAAVNIAHKTLSNGLEQLPAANR